jgi:hypothetical protein
MKRILFTMTLMLSLISMSSFANDNSEKVNGAVLASFKSNFRNATEVSWSVSQQYVKASFALNGQYVTAFYDNGGELIALTRHISSTQLPITLQAGLRKQYGDYWISELFEVANEEGTSYYVTLETADTRLVLKSEGTDWTSFQKQRKS